MSLEKEAAKLGIKGAKQGIKILWRWYRPWRTRLAYKREVEAEKRKAQTTLIPMMFIAVFVVSGCASLDKVYTGVDRTVYNGENDPYQNQIPDGYEIKDVIMDAERQPVDVTGWTVEQKMIQSASWKPTPLEIKSKRERSLVSEAIDTAKKLTASDEPSGAAEAIDMLESEAAKEPVK